MFYIGLILAIIGLLCLYATVVTLKKFKAQYGDTLGDFLNDNK